MKSKICFDVTRGVYTITHHSEHSNWLPKLTHFTVPYIDWPIPWRRSSLLKTKPTPSNSNLAINDPPRFHIHTTLRMRNAGKLWHKSRAIASSTGLRLSTDGNGNRNPPLLVYSPPYIHRTIIYLAVCTYQTSERNIVYECTFRAAGWAAGRLCLYK